MKSQIKAFKRPVLHYNLAMAKEKDPAKAIETLFELEGGRLHSLARRFCKNEEEAQDLVQDVFLSALKSWDQFDGRSKPSTWLYTIAARRCQRNQRKRAGEPEQLETLEELMPNDEKPMGIVPEASSPEGQLLRKEALESLEMAIASLPADFRMPLVLRDIVGLSVRDVASVLGLEETTVRTRVHRARLKTRQAIENALPKQELPPTPYSQQVCIDLLAAKQEALDRGVPCPIENEVVCSRCQALFSSLDLGQDLCQTLGEASAPKELEALIMGQIRAFRGSS